MVEFLKLCLLVWLLNYVVTVREGALKSFWDFKESDCLLLSSKILIIKSIKFSGELNAFSVVVVGSLKAVP